MEKETALREETSTSGSKNDEEERIVDHREIRAILATALYIACSGHINVKKRPNENTGRPRQLRAIAEQEEKRKKEKVNYSDE